MKIIMLCGCLEQGKDGVGDYCRLIASELVQQRESEIMLLSLNDPYVSTQEEVSEKKNLAVIEVRRIPSKNSHHRRFELAKKYIDDFSPQWISLQYVPYSFHSKGMDLSLPRSFSKLKGDYKWHLMIHEPWSSGGSLFSKNGITGLVQKQLLRILVEKLRPDLINTSNVHYRSILKGSGIQSELLHLPGNIPVFKGTKDLLKKEFGELGITEASKKQWLMLGTFGRLRPNVSYTGLLKKLFNSSESEGKRIAFLSIGNAGPYTAKIAAEIQREYKEMVIFHRLGQREEAEISGFFQWLDYGVASVPGYLLGKSGAYAAMRNHGLDILVPESKEPGGNDLNRGSSSNYLQEIPDKDFASKKVAEMLLVAFRSEMSKTNNRAGNENIIH